MPTRKEDLPGTIQRSDKHAQSIYAKTHDSAVQTYGEGRRAHQTALASLKRSYRKAGDRWVPKDEKGPAASKAARSSTSSRKSTDKGRAEAREVPLTQWPREALYSRAQNLDITGRSRMTKSDLVRAIKKAS